MMQERFSIHEQLIGEPTLAEKLSSIHDPDHYPLMGAQFTRRVGTAAVLVTNERFPLEGFQLSPLPDGYIIGPGNGRIWSMLELFPPEILPKGVISLDYDPSVVLSGKVLVELAKRDISREEAIAHFFGDCIDDSRSIGCSYFSHTVDEVVMLARELAIREQNPQFRQVLLDEINGGSFVEDMQLLRHLEKKQRPPDIRRRKNITPTIHEHWETIVRLATEGRIFFGHSDLANEHTLDFIETHVPEIKSSRNIIYTSNIVDTRYSRELNGLERFNLQGESWYVFTTQQPDDYVLKTSHQPPPFPGKLYE